MESDDSRELESYDYAHGGGGHYEDDDSSSDMTSSSSSEEEEDDSSFDDSSNDDEHIAVASARDDDDDGIDHAYVEQRRQLRLTNNYGIRPRPPESWDKPQRQSPPSQQNRYNDDDDDSISSSSSGSQEDMVRTDPQKQESYLTDKNRKKAAAAQDAVLSPTNTTVSTLSMPHMAEQKQPSSHRQNISKETKSIPTNNRTNNNNNNDPKQQKNKKKKKWPSRINMRMEALGELEANVQDALQSALIHSATSNNEHTNIHRHPATTTIQNSERARRIYKDDDDNDDASSAYSSSSSSSSAASFENSQAPLLELLHGFEALLATLLEMSDELEIWLTLNQMDGKTKTKRNKKSKTKKSKHSSNISVTSVASTVVVVSENALNAVLSHAPVLDDVFIQLKPILQSCLTKKKTSSSSNNNNEEPSQIQSPETKQEMYALLQRGNLLVRLLRETTGKVCDRQEWNPRSETSFVTLLELLERTTTELQCLHQHKTIIPDYHVTAKLRRAWRAAGHTKELKTLYALCASQAEQGSSFSWLLRQLCYDVLISCDYYWCPNQQELGQVCDVTLAPNDESLSRFKNKKRPDVLMQKSATALIKMDEVRLAMAPIPPMALQVLDDIQGEPLERADIMASILRRILPPDAMLTTTPDASNAASNAEVSSILRRRSLTKKQQQENNAMGGGINTVVIASAPETWNDPASMGISGVGKSTMAAMVASNGDVRRYFRDGIAWIHVGSQEMNYKRYTACLRELCAQLVYPQKGAPIVFADLVYTVGEPRSARERREEGFMVYARDTVATLLRGRHVLIVLDNVNFESDLAWFQFNTTGPMSSGPGEDWSSSVASSSITNNTAQQEPFQLSVLATTRRRDLLPAADTVEIDLLDEDDAIKLLLSESGQTSDDVMAESEQARLVVRECANHPLAVKSVGRWLSLKHASASVISSVEEISEDMAHSIDKIMEAGDLSRGNMMFEILNMSFSPAVNGKPTLVIKFCFAAFTTVFCREEYHSLFSPSDVAPLIPIALAEMLFDTLLELEEEVLFQEGSLFFAARQEATLLIPEALSALGVLKVISSKDGTSDDSTVDSSLDSMGEQKYLQIVHGIQHEYGEYLFQEEEELQDLTRDAERRWNWEFVRTYLSSSSDWDSDLPDASRDYAVEMLFSHMLRAEMYQEASELLSNEKFVRGRLFSMGRENATRQHIVDCETLFRKLQEQSVKSRIEIDPWDSMERAYEALGGLLTAEGARTEGEEGRIVSIEAGRAHYDIGFSLAEKRCWARAIAHWETSQELLVSSLGMVEFVAAILFNAGVVLAEMNEYDKALASLKQCLRIRGAIHGEEHILYAQTIQKIGDVFLGMSDYKEAIESYSWALDVMHIEPSYHRVNIGDILDNMGNVHYSKGNVPEALRCYRDALRSKKIELGNDDPDLAATYQHIGNCLSDQGETKQAITHFEEAIRLRKLDSDNLDERDADVLSIEGVLNNLNGRQKEGLQCYEKSLEILVTRVPHKKEKIAALLHLIGCVYLMNGEHKKAKQLFEESLQTRRKVLGFVHLDVASTLFNLAFLHQTRNRIEKALTCLKEALKIRQLRLPDSEKVALTLEKIASLSKSVGKSKKAEAAYQEALRVRKLIHGESHEAVAAVLHELGDLMDDLGEYEEAMSYYIEALDIRRKRLGPDHEEVASTLYSMGFALHNQGSSERALQCFEEALNIRKVRLGEDSKEVGDTLNMMGFLQAKRGETDDALCLLWDALRIRKLQKDNIKVSETLKNIGNVHREKREHELAIECYEESLRIRRTELGDVHEKVADVLVAIGNVESDIEDTDEAMRAYEEALAIRTSVHGENNESVATVLQYMGTMEFRAGDFEAARRFLEEFVRIRRENQSENDGDYVNVLFMLGNIHKIEGRDDSARQCWSEAYDVFQDLGLASESPEIAKVMESLLRGDTQPSEETIGNVTDNNKRGFLGRFNVTGNGTLGDEAQKSRPRRKKSARKLV